jgi:2-polyprenyl-6-methoxyphenol hydroxylase-like FAD-dependent oxidoreductase
MTSTNLERVPVAIVRGGPVGLAVALELGRQGIQSILIEQTETTNDFPRMLFVNYRSMQHCRRWGIADQVRARTVYPDSYPLDIVFATGLDGQEITRFNYPGHGEAVLPNEVPEKSQIYPQNIFDPLMVETAKATPNTDIRFSHRLNSFDQDEEGVTLQVSNLEDDSEFTICADYLVACDGAASPVRKALKIEMVGEFHDHNISVLFRAPDILKKTDLQPARHVHIIGVVSTDRRNTLS